jgi:hypothetical protein
MVAQAMSQKAVTSGRVSAADVAQATFEAIDSNQFYIFSHSFATDLVRARMNDVVNLKNPSDPFADKPEIGEALRRALKE